MHNHIPTEFVGKDLEQETENMRQFEFCDQLVRETVKELLKVGFYFFVFCFC